MQAGVDSVASRRRARAGVGALVALTIGWALVMQSLGWAQTSYYALVKALGDGTTQIDAYHWETRDKSWIDGHFYSVKAPGLALLVTPPYLALDALGAPALARRAADEARRGGARQWTYRGLHVHAYGHVPERAAQIKRRLEVQAPMVWALGLFGTVAPSLLLLVLLRRRVDALEPGLGTLAAITLGTATLVMPFAINLFGHALAALLGFAAFLVIWSERERATAQLTRLLLAGVLAGLAVTTEYPLAITGAIVGLYAVLRPGVLGAPSRLRRLLARAAAYAGGVVLGLVPLLLYNLVAFGSATKLSYANAVNEQGRTGHASIGLNDGGFFGIGMPDPRVALELLLSPRGLLVITPVLAMAIPGLLVLVRRGRRSEALVIVAVALAYWVYNAGYWLPMGGGSAGPRFLIPALPFLAVALGLAWRRHPGVTLALAVPSAMTMLAATITYPLVTFGQTGQWTQRADRGVFQHTTLSLLGQGNGWIAITPVIIAVVAAWALAFYGTPRLAFAHERAVAWLALAVWGAAAGLLAPAIGETEISGRLVGPTGQIIHGGHGTLVLVGMLAGAVALGAAQWRSRDLVDDEPPSEPAFHAEAVETALAPGGPRRSREPIGVQHHGPDPEPA